MTKLTDEQIREMLNGLPKGPWEWIEDRWHGGWRGIVDTYGEQVLWPILDPDDEDIDRFPWFHEEELDGNVRSFTIAARELVPQLLERAQAAEGELEEEEVANKMLLADAEILRKELIAYIRDIKNQNKRIHGLEQERNDLKAMLADAGVRNTVLQARLDRLLDLYGEDMAEEGGCAEDMLETCNSEYDGEECAKCWRNHAVTKLEEVQP